MLQMLFDICMQIKNNTVIMLHYSALALTRSGRRRMKEGAWTGCWEESDGLTEQTAALVLVLMELTLWQDDTVQPVLMAANDGGGEDCRWLFSGTGVICLSSPRTDNNPPMSVLDDVRHMIVFAISRGLLIVVPRSDVLYDIASFPLWSKWCSALRDWY